MDGNRRKRTWQPSKQSPPHPPPICPTRSDGITTSRASLRTNETSIHRFFFLSLFRFDQCQIRPRLDLNNVNYFLLLNVVLYPIWFFVSLFVRWTKGGGGACPASSSGGKAAAAADEEEEDVDLFGDSDKEDDAEKERIKEERLKAYAEKKSKSESRSESPSSVL